MLMARGLLGIVALLFFAWLLSSDRRRFPWKIVIGGLLLLGGNGGVVWAEFDNRVPSGLAALLVSMVPAMTVSR